MIRLDVHAWFGHWQFWDLHHKSPDDLLRVMDRHTIGRAVCMSLRGLVDWKSGNEETLAVAAGHADRLLPAVTVAPCHGGGAQMVQQLADAGACSLRLYPTFHNYRLGHAFVDDVCRAAGQCGLLVTIPTRVMSSWRFAALEVDDVAAVVERHPGTCFVMSGVNYTAEFEALLRLMKRCDNVWTEISCFQGFNAIGRLVAEIGADRVLFGTGTLLHYAACGVAKLDRAAITDEQRTAIAGVNARALLTHTT